MYNSLINSCACVSLGRYLGVLCHTVTLCPCQHLPFFFLLQSLYGLKWYLILYLIICMPLLSKVIKLLFMCIFAISIFSLEKCLF